jgi:ribosome maturation factor RimP
LTSLQQIVEQALAGLGYELVDLEFVARGLLRVFIDRPGQPLGPTIEDCEAASRQLVRVLEVEGIDFSRLEVSSPGLDRALKKPADFERFAGEQVAIRMRLPIEGRRQFQGVLRAGESGRWLLEWTDEPPPAARGARRPARAKAAVDGTTGKAGVEPLPLHRVEFALDDIERARLVPQFEFSGVTGR